MSLVTLNQIYFSVGEHPLLDYVDFEIDHNERIALIGRNGQGKSTLFKILSGAIQADAGKILKGSHVKIARLAQDLPLPGETTVYEAVALGLESLAGVLVEYHALLQSEVHDDAWLNRLTVLQQQIDHADGWSIQQRIEQTIEALDLPSEAKLSELSGGWRRRVALAQTLVQEPDVLLLDEPTNHLDLQAIQWLEEFLLKYPKTIMFVTHDRSLLKKIATRIVELDRGKLTSYPADYEVYLERKEADLQAEQRQNALFDKKLSLEEQWIRQGIKARRTRNEGRVRALKALREERSQRRELQDKPNFSLNTIVKQGKTIVQAENISFGYGPDKPIIKDFSFILQRGDKLAIVGPNGAGKTTLAKLLLGLIPPDSGMIKHSPTIQVAFSDQTRDTLKLKESLINNVAEGDDFIEIGGARRHVISYLGDFLFDPAKCHTFAETLSGGEQNRLLLAKLFAKPANVLILDEPTNDLDMETLELLEGLLLDYQGTVILISHDRAFIDNIATHTVMLEGEGRFTIDVGGYSDWLARAKKPSKGKEQKVIKEKPAPEKKTSGLKLSNGEQRELAALPATIERLEEELSVIQAQMCDPAFFSKSPEEIKRANERVIVLESSLKEAYAKWQALEARQNNV